MHRVTVHVRTAAGSTSATAEFLPGEVDLLREFRHKSLALSNVLVTSGFDGVGIKVHAVANEPVRVYLKSSMLDDKVRSAVLHRVRPFILQRERHYLQKVANVLQRRFENERFRELVARECDHFYGRRNSQGIRVDAGGKVVNSLDTLMTYLNAYEYHSDQKLEQEYQAIPGPPELTLGLVLNQLTDVIRAVMNVGYIVDRVLDPRDAPIDMRRFRSFAKA